MSDTRIQAKGLGYGATGIRGIDDISKIRQSVWFASTVELQAAMEWMRTHGRSGRPTYASTTMEWAPLAEGQPSYAASPSYQVFADELASRES